MICTVVDHFENAFRFLEHTRDKLKQHRVQATMSHIYFVQDRLDQAIDRANASLRMLRDWSMLRDGDGEESESDHLKSLALIVLVKAKLKQGDASAAQAQIEELLQTEPSDHMLLASVCEELASLGTAHLPAATAILVHFVRAIGALPITPGPMAARTNTASGGATTSPVVVSNAAAGAGSRATIRSEMLAGATRALVTMRLKTIAAIESGDKYAAESTKEAVLDALLADLRRVASRASKDGSAVCDDPAHLEWLSVTAWNLAVNQAKTMSGSSASEAEGGKATERSRSASVLCAELADVSCDLTAALPPTESRLHSMLRDQIIVTRTRLRLAVAKQDERDGTEQLARASNSLSTAFRLHQRWVQAASVGLPSIEPQPNSSSPSTCAVVETGSEEQAGEVAETRQPMASGAMANEVVSTLQILNFEIALLRSDPNARAVLQKISELDCVSTMQLLMVADRCFRARKRYAHTPSWGLPSSRAS